MRAQFRAVGYLAGTLGRGLVGIVVLVIAAVVGVLAVVGVGVLLTGVASAAVRRWADHDRARTGRFLGRPIGSPYPPSPSLGPSAARDHAAGGTLRRDLTTMLLRTVVGIPLGLAALLLPLVALNSALLPAYWWALPPDETAGALFTVTSWWGAAASTVAGLAGFALWATAPWVARADARVTARLLVPSREQDLRRLVALEQSRRRATASAHAAELRRIERDLHDAAQNRLVALSMFVGMAQRQVSTGRGDPTSALDKAQAAASGALGEVRRIIQGIHPSELADQGLLPALGLLTDRAQIPTRLQVDQPAPTPAAVDAALYYTVAEALTNVAKHSNAGSCDVRVGWQQVDQEVWVEAEIVDDGKGGATTTSGGGLAGLEERIHALGGWLHVASPDGGPTSVRVGLPCES